MDQGTEGLGLVTRPHGRAPREAEWPVRGLSQLPSGRQLQTRTIPLLPGALGLLLGAGSWLKESSWEETYLLIPGEPVSGGMGHFPAGLF